MRLLEETISDHEIYKEIMISWETRIEGEKWDVDNGEYEADGEKSDPVEIIMTIINEC